MNLLRNRSTSKLNQADPVFYEDRIVWADYRNGNWDIYMYDLSTKKETQITNNMSDQEYPAIYGDRIVWMDYRKGFENSDTTYVHYFSGGIKIKKACCSFFRLSYLWKSAVKSTVH